MTKVCFGAPWLMPAFDEDLSYDDYDYDFKNTVSSSRNAVINESNKWPLGEIPYLIDSSFSK